jgi:hypothetical protein
MNKFGDLTTVGFWTSIVNDKKKLILKGSSAKINRSSS